MIVLREPVRSCERPGFDLTAVGRDSEIGNCGVLGLTRAVRHHSGVSRTLGHRDRIERFGEGADLVHLDQDRVGQPLADPIGKSLGVGHEKIIADELAAIPQGFGQRRPAFEVVLGTAILDRQDRVLLGQIGEIGDHPCLVEGLALPFQMIFAVLEELGGGDVESEPEVLAWGVTRLLSRHHDERERRVG